MKKDETLKLRILHFFAFFDFRHKIYLILYPSYGNFTTHAIKKSNMAQFKRRVATRRWDAKEFRPASPHFTWNSLLPVSGVIRIGKPVDMIGKVIHPKYYKHLKKGAHQSHLHKPKNGLVSGRLACTSSKSEILTIWI